MESEIELNVAWVPRIAGDGKKKDKTMRMLREVKICFFTMNTPLNIVGIV